MIQIVSFIISFVLYYGIDFILQKYCKLVSNHIYFLLHFLVNMFITVTILQFTGLFLSDPLGFQEDKYYE
jgi:hypothetical protein